MHECALMSSPPVSSEEIVEVLGEVDASIVDRIVDTGASADELGEAIDDLDHERRFAERRLPASTRIAELRSILDDLSQEPDAGVRVIQIHGGKPLLR